MRRPHKLSRSYWIWFVVTGMVLLPALFYLGWCWGWIGRDNLWLQYLLQCRCPAATEEARYPDDVDVLLSACSGHEAVAVSPGGRFLIFAGEDDSGGWYDFQGAALQEPTVEPAVFLSDDLLLLTSEGGRRQSVVDRATGEETPLTLITPDRLGGEYWIPEPTLLLPLLASAEFVYLHDHTVVILGARRTPESQRQDFYTQDHYWWRDPVAARAGFGQIFEERQIAHVFVDSRNGQELPSPSGRFVARPDGIYLTASGERLVENIQDAGQTYLQQLGWIYDERGLVVQPVPARLFSLPNTPPWPLLPELDVPQPVLILKVPTAYLN